jgi:excisionase family DNA binding protein
MKSKPKKTRSAAALEARALRMVADYEAETCTEEVRFPERARKAIPFHERIYGTVKQTCEATGLGHDTIYRLMKSGRVESIRIGKRRLIVISSLLKLGNIDDLPRSASKQAPQATPDFGLEL